MTWAPERWGGRFATAVLDGGGAGGGCGSGSGRGRPCCSPCFACAATAPRSPSTCRWTPTSSYRTSAPFASWSPASRRPRARSGLPPPPAPGRARSVPSGRERPCPLLPQGWGLLGRERPCPPCPAGSGPRILPGHPEFGIVWGGRSLPSRTLGVWGQTHRFSLKIHSGEGSESLVTCGPTGKGSVRARHAAERQKIVRVCFGLFSIAVSEEFDA